MRQIGQFTGTKNGTGHRLAIDPHETLPTSQGPENDFHQRRFTRTVPPAERRYFTETATQADVGQHPVLPKRMHDAVYFQPYLHTYAQSIHTHTKSIKRETEIQTENDTAKLTPHNSARPQPALQ